MRFLKYLMVEVELAPLFKDTESDIPEYGVCVCVCVGGGLGYNPSSPPRH